MTDTQRGTEISIEHLSVHFGDVVAVNDLSLTIEEGELLVLLGPSGCGKTTTMRCVAGLATPSDGTIMFDDTCVYSHDRRISTPANRRDVGMVFQSYAIWPHKTVAQNVGFPLKVRGKSKGEISKAVDEVLELVGLSGLGSRGASLLSGGQMQRVALARSLIMDPRVLLMDEPLSNLDAKLRDRLRFELRELQDRVGVTSIYVTHDQSEAFALADRIAVMKDGVIVQLGGPREVYRKPASRFVADFLGMANIFEIEESSPSRIGTKIVLKDSGCVLEVEQGPPPEGAAFMAVPDEGIRVFAEAPTNVADQVNVFEGQVSVFSFLGGRVHYRIRLDAGLAIDAESSHTRTVHEVGERVHVQFPPAALRILGE